MHLFVVVVLFLQRRLGLALTQGSTDLVGRVLLSSRRQQFTTSLAHVVLLLHGSKLLVLKERQGKRNTQEEGRCRNDPGTLAAEGQDTPGTVGNGAHPAGHPSSRGRGHNVAQGVQALGERLVLGIEVGFIGNLGVCRRTSWLVDRATSSTMEDVPGHTGIRVVFILLELGSGVLLEVLVFDLGESNHFDGF